MSKDEEEAQAQQLDTWREADAFAGIFSRWLNERGVHSCAAATAGMLLLAADDVLENDAGDEEAFVETARSAYRIRKNARREAAEQLVRTQEGGDA